MGKPKRVIPKCAMPNGDTDTSAVKALHQLISKRNEGVTEGFKKLALAANGKWDGVDAEEYVKELRSDASPKRGVLSKYDRTPVGNLTEEGIRQYQKDHPKRGKDIKTFADLPPDVRLTIDLSDIGPKEHARRVAEAINIYSQTDSIQQE